MEFDTIESVIKDLQKGKLIIVIDDVERENEGDFLVAAELATPGHINFMTMYGRGLVCIAMEKKRLDSLGIRQMVSEKENTEPKRCKFAVSVDAKKGTTTGISAFDRAHTTRVLVDKKTKPEDLLKPGHTFPLQAHEGGLKKRQGHTEAAIELSKLAGLYPAGVICEILREDGRMARAKELFELKKRFGMKIIRIEDLIEYIWKKQ